MGWEKLGTHSPTINNIANYKKGYTHHKSGDVFAKKNIENVTSSSYSDLTIWGDSSLELIYARTYKLKSQLILTANLYWIAENDIVK